MSYQLSWCALALCVPATVYAQSVTSLDELVVTASRVATPQEQVGNSLTVITAAQLEQQQIRLVSDALRLVPGLAVNRSGGTGTLTRVRIRGAEDNHTLVLIDGIEANDPAFGSTFDFAHLLSSEIERIEVLRGPQSALWGSDAIGGVVNIITKSGNGPAKVRASLEGGSFGTLQGSASISGGDRQFNYALGASRLVTDGVSVAPHGSEEDGYHNSSFNLKLGAQPLEGLNLDLVTRYTRARAETDPQDYNFPPSATFGQVIDGDDINHSEQLYSRLQGTLQLGQWTQRVGLAVTDTQNEFFSDGAKTNSTDGRKRKLDYQSSYQFGERDHQHTVVFAAEHEREEFHQRGQTADAPSNQDQSMTNTGLIGEYRIGLWEQLFLSAAVRRDHNDFFDDATTYRLSAAYLLDSGTRLHSSYGTGVTNPTFTELFGYYPDTFVGNPNLKPEKARGWDIGVEQPFWDGQVVLDLTYFRSTLSDEIVSTFDMGTYMSSVDNGAGRSHRQGLELSAKAALRDNLDLNASYTYTDSTDASDQDELRRPRHVASMDLAYRWDDRTRVNLNVAYNGQQYDNDYATTPETRVTLADYTLVTLGANYRLNPQLELYGRVENLLDQDYQDVYGYATPGIGAYMGIKAEF